MSKSVQSNSAVLVHFTLKLDDGSTAESTRSNGKPALFRLGDTSLSEGLEQQLLGLKEGEKKAFSLEPDAAFGVPSPDLIQYFSRREFIDAGEPDIGDYALYRKGWQRNAWRDPRSERRFHHRRLQPSAGRAHRSF